MTARLLKGLVVGLLLSFLMAASEAVAQDASHLGSAPLTRVGVVVRDAQKAAKAYADIFQMASVPAVTTVKVDLPKGSMRVRRAVVNLPNTRIEVDQPEGSTGPAAEYLKKFGQGIYRVGFSTPDPIEAKVAFLESKGGKLTAGSKSGKFAWVDLTSMVGTTIEIQQETVPAGMSSAPATPAATGKIVLATTPMSHLGWAVTNTDQVSKNFAEILGIPAPKVNEFKPVDIPPNYKADPSSTLRLTSWKQANAGMELIQSIGQTNWNDFTSKHGNNSAPQHLAFPVGDQLEQTVRLFEKKGASWTNGKVGGTYEYLDFTESLGIIFELNGKWTGAASN